MTNGTAKHDIVTRQLQLEGVEVAVTSYRIGERYSCTVDNIDPGAVIGRGSGPDRQTAEEAAINQASMKILKVPIKRNRFDSLSQNVFLRLNVAFDCKII